ARDSGKNRSANRSLHIGLPMMAVSTLLLILMASRAYGQYAVHGKKLDWQMTAAAGWIGGSVDQIEEARNRAIDPESRKFMDQMRAVAVKVDALLLDPKAAGAPMLRVDVIDVVEAFPDTDEAWRLIWEQVAKMTLQLQPKGSTAKIISNRRWLVDGKNAQEG